MNAPRPHAHRAWLHSAGRLALLLLAGAGLGLALGHLWLGLCLSLIAVLAWHYWKLHQLLQHLAARRSLPPPRGTGVWNELDRHLFFAQSGMRLRKRRLLSMLRAYRAAAAAMPDAVVVVERNRQRVLWFNEAATPLLGLRYPQHQDASVVSALQPLPIATWLAAGRNAETMADVPSPTDPALRLDLRLIPYSAELWLLIARDVSRSVHAERMRRDFVANVSHELRTPLTVVHGYLEMLDPAEHPEWAAQLGEMQRQSTRMTQLVEDLLTLSRLDGRDRLPEEPVAMAAMLASLRHEAEALSQGKHRITVDDAAGVDLLGSGKELHSAFSNLVINAIRHTPEGGQVAIRFSRDAVGGAVLSVCDTGQGIPAEHLPRITERFYRVSTSRSRESGGTGLGLAIAKHALGLHDARLDIHSTVGTGSTFACQFGAERVLPREA